ncbi:unnamed protein product [Polarella glacialis]|uniref:Nodulin-like domain-containing protein n=1 Tax=Polarella glacialis TaxID=89957 RepID=A0A813FGR4_POLGL|nr:unnamed protein product [Polarella glacialis]
MLLISGTIYGFGAWSSILKEHDGYALDQVHVEALALAAHLGNYMVLDTGLIVSHFGTSLAFALGCLYACFGYLGVWLATAMFPGQLPLELLAFSCFLFGHGCGSIDNAAMTEIISDFPDHKGYVVGCAKAYYGLATATVATIYKAAFAPRKTDFLLFLSVYSLVVGLVLTPMIWKTRGRVNEPRAAISFKLGLLMLGILAFSLFLFVVQLNDLSAGQSKAVLAIVVGGALSPFLLARGGPSKLQHGTSSPDAQDEIEPDSQLLRVPPVDITGWAMMRTLNFYLLMLVLIVGQGAGLLFLANSAQILPAYRGEGAHADTTAFVSVISIFNAFGRLLFGAGSERLVGWVHRPLFLLLSVVILGLSYLSLVAVGQTAVWPCAAAVGLGYGGLWGVQPSIVMELFGPSQYGFKYSLSVFSALIGSSLFSTLLAGRLFDAEAERLGSAPDCFAESCFRLAFTVTAACTVPAGILACWLASRTACLYGKLAPATPEEIRELTAFEGEAETAGCRAIASNKDGPSLGGGRKLQATTGLPRASVTPIKLGQNYF